ncbi:YlbD family protein [Litchfieldia alkalitelluris]|uniref:YlbD family protein n=1 Tax=Litchfieldia alkalitelluris TaxID=304268 RepID=UPI000996F071|nr:YlbD family protein [Litchfieldia alkalitelluris]
MGKQKVHPTIEEFKNFVKKHPKLIQEVRNGNKSWQVLYEDWYLLGENDDTWSKYKMESTKGNDEEKDKKSDFIEKFLSTIKNVKMNDVQEQITNVGSAITTIQQVIHQFQGGSKDKSINNEPEQKHPFAFRKD